MITAGQKYTGEQLVLTSALPENTVHAARNEYSVLCGIMKQCNRDVKTEWHLIKRVAGIQKCANVCDTDEFLRRIMACTVRTSAGLMTLKQIASICKGNKRWTRVCHAPPGLEGRFSPLESHLVCYAIENSLEWMVATRIGGIVADPLTTDDLIDSERDFLLAVRKGHYEPERHMIVAKDCLFLEAVRRLQDPDVRRLAVLAGRRAGRDPTYYLEDWWPPIIAQLEAIETRLTGRKKSENAGGARRTSPMKQRKRLPDQADDLSEE